MRSSSIVACLAFCCGLFVASPTLDALIARRQAKGLGVRADHQGDTHMTDAPSSDTASSADTVQRPPLTDAEFKLKAKKGRQFHDWMSITSIKELDKAMQKAGKTAQGQSSQSSFVDPADIAHGGWFDSDGTHVGKVDDNDCNLPTPVCDVLKSLAVSTKTRAAGGFNELSYLSQEDKCSTAKSTNM